MSGTLLDEVLPQWHHRERHAVTVDAPAERIWAAARRVGAADLPLVRALFRLRGLPIAVDRPLYELEGFAVLAEDAGTELVVGAVGQPWRPRGNLRTDADVASFDEPGYARIAMSLRLDGTRLSTETRVHLTDARSRRLFGAYWLVVRPFSALIRRAWLRAIARSAYSSS